MSKTFLVEKLGMYRSRVGKIMKVTEIDNRDFPGAPYPVKGEGQGVSGPYLTSWKTNGAWKSGAVADDDLVEYLSIEEYPEMYI